MFAPYCENVAPIATPFSMLKSACHTPQPGDADENRLRGWAQVVRFTYLRSQLQLPTASDPPSPPLVGWEMLHPPCLWRRAGFDRNQLENATRTVRDKHPIESAADVDALAFRVGLLLLCNMRPPAFIIA